ncbi:MAG: ABC transporter ATP-binding protein [Agathobacter sp.]|nr:ABC transporter ATP-binding protein [Agathobacter sp.]
MGKIFKNMLPYWKWILLIILLLTVQAFCDLSLPQYTSDIIDVGIMNSGVEHILPEEMTAEDFASAQLFMTSKEKETFADCYKAPEGTGNYVRDCDDKTLEAMDEDLLEPIVMVYQMSQMKESDIDEKALTEKMGSEGAKVDLGQMMQALAAGKVEDEQILKMREGVSDQIDAIGASTLKSMGVTYAISCDKNAGVDTDSIQKRYLWTSGAKMLGFTLLMVVAAILVGYCASVVGAAVGRDLRDKTFRNVVQYSNAEMEQFSTASLITRSTNDVQQIQMVTTVFLRMILYAPIVGIGGIIKVAQTHAGMEWVIALAVLLIIGFVMVLVSISMPKFKIMQTLVDRLNLVSREILTGLSVIRAFGREKKEEERFDEANRSLTKTQLFTNRIMTFMMPGMMMIMYCITLLIVWVAAKRIDGGYMQVGAMTAFITYTMMIVMSFLMLTMMSIMMPRAGVAAERIEEVVNTKTSIIDTKEPYRAEKCEGVVKFSHVNFRYPGADEDVLSDIDFVAEPGKTTAIIGSTGCGKSTLVNLLPRFYDVTGGEITLDGVDIRKYSRKDLRESIGFVPQKGILFSGTIASNLRFGAKDATDEQIREAAEIAQASEFIEEKHDGYDSSIAQGGSNVSGGQKQRLAIARAIAKNPKIYVFDDSFSALDMKTDAALRKALKSRTENATVLIVAQRISTIINADQILVLDDGKIVGKGTHEKLLHSCEVYEQIARSQLSAKELGLAEEVG